MDKISDLLREAAARAVPVVRAIDESQFDAPTPCEQFSVRDLLNHLIHVTIGFQSLADKKPFDFGTTPDYLAGDWRDRFEAETKQLVEAWSDPSALDGVSPGMGLPQETVGNMILLDLTVHSWDLAQATGQEYQPHPDAVRSLHGLVEQMGPTARKMKVFGEPVPVPPDASDFERLLGATGRDPDRSGR